MRETSPTGTLLSRIASIFGADPIQYRYLLQTERQVEARALKSKKDSSMSLAIMCLGGFMMSLMSVFASVLASLDPFTYSLLGISMSMMMIGLWIIPYFDILLTPVNYLVIAHTPVASRTYFLVKLTQIIGYVLLLLTSLNLAPAIRGIWVYADGFSLSGLLFPCVYLPVVFLSGFFTVGLMATFAGYLTKLYTQRSVRNIAQYAQFIFPALFPVFLILPSRFSSRTLPEQLAAHLKWFYALPNGWFAGTVSLGLGQVGRDTLILTALAAAATLFLIFVPLRSVAKGYSEYLSYLFESGSKPKTGIRTRTPFLARLFKNKTRRAGFCLSATYLRRDRHILRQLFSAVGSGVILLVVFSRDSSTEILHSMTLGLSPGFTFFTAFFGIGLLSGFLFPVRYSEHWQAAWIFQLVPLSAPDDLWRGVQAAALCYIVLPCTLLTLGIALAMWGISGILYALPVLIIFLNFVVLCPKPLSGIPLSGEFVQKQVSAIGFVPGIIALIGIAALVGIQVAAHWWLPPYAYTSIYSLILLIGTLHVLHHLLKNPL